MERGLKTRESIDNGNHSGIWKFTFGFDLANVLQRWNPIDNVRINFLCQEILKIVEKLLSKIFVCKYNGEKEESTQSSNDDQSEKCVYSGNILFLVSGV